MSDFKLIAVNQLIEKYELDLAKNINMDNEQNLDVMQISNLHKMEMVTLGFELGNNVDLMQNIHDRIEETTPRIETKEYNMKVVSPHEECSTESPEIVYKKKDEKLSKTINYPKTKKYKNAVKNTNKAYDKLVEGFKNYQDKLGCIDCKNVWNYKEGELIPEYEISWELKKFLSDLKSLTADIKDSLDSTKLLKDFCVYFELFKGENKLCLSSWPLLLASFPLLINKAKFELLELGFSWTGIIGPIIAPLLSIAVKLIELLKNLILAPLDCIIRALNLMKETLIALDKVIASYVEQAKMVGSTISNLSFEGTEVNYQLLGSKVNNLEEDVKKATKQKESTPGYIEPKSNILENVFERIYDKFIEAAANTKDTSVYTQRSLRAREILSDLNDIPENKVSVAQKFTEQNKTPDAIQIKSKEKATTNVEEKASAPKVEPPVRKDLPTTTKKEEDDVDSFYDDEPIKEKEVKEKVAKKQNPLFIYSWSGNPLPQQRDGFLLKFPLWSNRGLTTLWNGRAPHYETYQFEDPYRVMVDLYNVKKRYNNYDLMKFSTHLPITKWEIQSLEDKQQPITRIIFYLKKGFKHTILFKESEFIFKIQKDHEQGKLTAIPQIKQEKFESVSYAQTLSEYDDSVVAPFTHEEDMGDEEDEAISPEVVSTNEKIEKAIKPKAKSESNVSKKKDGSGLTFGFKTQDPYAYKSSLTVKPDSIFTNNTRESYLGGIINVFDLLRNGVINARNYVDAFFNKYIYLLKSIQRLIVEPIFISSKLIGEIKVALNLIRLFKVIAQLINSDFKGICKDFNNDENNSFVKSLIEKEFEDTIIDTQGEKGRLLAKGKDSDFVSRLEPNDCGEILVKMNHKQRDLDLIYDKIANSIR